MKVIGLTGNIGCGKSTVSGMLRDLGVATIDADEVARQVRNNDGTARDRIERRFGTTDAGELAEVVFTDPSALADLEAILHPPVRDEVRSRLAELMAAGWSPVASNGALTLRSGMEEGASWRRTEGEREF